MRITTALIRTLNPCPRFEVFDKHYPDFDGNLAKFLSLDHIKYSDKVWVVTKLLNNNELAKWSILCARSVWTRYPDNENMYNLFFYLEGIPDFTNLTEEQKSKIWQLRLKVKNTVFNAASIAAVSAAKAAVVATVSKGTSIRTTAISTGRAAIAATTTDEEKREQKRLNLALLFSISEEG